MASQSSSIEALISSRNTNLSLFLPFILDFTNTRSEPDPDQDLENPDQDPNNPDQETPDPPRPDQDSLIERLISSRNSNLSVFLPFILGFTNTGSEPDPDQDSENPDRETPDPPRLGSSGDRVVLVNPVTQEMVVIERGSLGFDSLLQEFMREDGQPPASKASIDEMPSVEIRGEGDEIESLGGECVICLEAWGVGDVAKEMPCQHKFHGGCVEKWLKIHGSCPVCRYKMPVDEGQNGDKKMRGFTREIWVNLSFRSESQRSNQEPRESNDTSSSENP